MSYKSILILLLSFGLSFSCQKSKDPKPGEPSSTEMEYKPNSVVLDEKADEAILSVSEDESTYVFKSAAFDKVPTIGQTILIPGKLMRKVVSVKKVSNNYEIVTTDAVLTDVIENGTIAFEITPDWNDNESLMVDGKRASRISSADGKVIEFAMTAQGVEYKIAIEPTQTGGSISSCKFKFAMIKKKGGTPNVSLVAEGTMTLPTQNTNITIKDGKLQKFTSENKGMSGTIELSLAAADGEPGETSQKLPNIALSIPIKYLPTPYGPIPNPIPMSIDVGIQFVTAIKFTGKTTSATAKSTITYNADGGFNYTGASVDTKGSLNNDAVTGGTFDSAGFIGSEVDVQFGVAFPRVSLVIAKQELAYIHVGFTTGSSLRWGPLCKSGYTKVLVEGGYALKVLGSTIYGEQKTFAEKKKEAKGEGCK